MEVTVQHLTIFGIILGTLGLFVWGRIRYDMVAVLALLTGVFLGVVPGDHAFVGFSHPAVITVAAVLVISRALQNSGIVDVLATMLASTRATTTRQIAGGSCLVALLSCIMNNVGALALMMPVTLRNAGKARRSASLVLIPLSFASLLGGLVTLIGTPTNLVISGYRESFTGESYNMFDFTPVGGAVAIAGLAYLIFIAWRLLPERVTPAPGSSLFHVENYITEARVPEGSMFVGMQIRELEQLCEDEIAVMALVRNGRRRLAPHGIERLRKDDVLVLEGDPSALEPLTAIGKLENLADRFGHGEKLRSDDVRLIEAVVLPHSRLEGRSMRGVRMHDRFGINLLAIARRGESPVTRLVNTHFEIGDVLLLQGEATALDEALRRLGLLQLADRGLRKMPKHHVALPVVIFGIAIMATAFGLVHVSIAFTTAVAALIATGSVPIREIYTYIEWPVIVLLSALIPVGEALQATGGTDLIASSILNMTEALPVWSILVLLLVISMWMSDLIHNTPTAVLMAPIAATIAAKLGVSLDPFLMAVAVGCASPYLTPIGHQSNTLVMGPGGYHFGDYTRVGLPLEVLIVVVAVPTIMMVWPL